ncbi:MAG TPA: hypothetical protein VGE02_07085, partial [Gemmatimonadales bacterium]
MRGRLDRVILGGTLTAILVAAAGLVTSCSDDSPPTAPELDRTAHRPDRRLVAEGREIFRYDTFGDEQYWTDTLRMHEVVQDSVSPLKALGVGLKVDLDALPQSVRDALAFGRVDLEDPAVTVALLELDAVVGLRGEVRTVDGRKELVSLGVTCALCHSTVDDAFAPGIGHRR